MHKGLHQHRLKDNPLEKVFSIEWWNQNKNGKTLEYLLAETPNKPNGEMTPRDIEVSSTVVQWLGSNVGQSFLLDVLHSKEAEHWRKMFNNGLSNG